MQIKAIYDSPWYIVVELISKRKLPEIIINTGSGDAYWAIKMSLKK